MSLLATLATLLSPLLTTLLAVPLEVYPSQGNGFAGAILGAIVGLGLLALVMVFISSKPKRRRREP